MMFQDGLFFIVAGLAVLFALMVILFNDPVKCALSLVAVFIASSLLWILVQAEFLGLILVLVYVGAVMTLFLFVVMMLDVEKISKKRYLVRYLPFGLIVVAFVVTFMWCAIKPEHWSMSSVMQASLGTNNVESLGAVLYTVYAYPLEIAAVLLLISIISAIVLAHRPPRNCRVQKIAEQLAVRKEERLRIIKQ